MTGAPVPTAGTGYLDQVRQVAQAVLYEGYLLWPYRQSALKNRQRWTLGGVYPQLYSRGAGTGDPWLIRTQCLLRATPQARVEVRLRFLHLVTRQVTRLDGDRLDPVPELTVAGERHLPGQEATEREVVAPQAAVAALAPSARRFPVDVPAGGDTTPVGDPPAGAVVRTWLPLTGRLETRAEPVGDGLFRVTAQVENTTPYDGRSRPDALARTFLSAHLVLHTDAGEFVSMMDPPDHLQEAAAGCDNTGCWPVLAGPPGDYRTVLAAPIILYDHPRVAPESPGDLFDATEIDQLLTLSILSLSEQERQEARDSDPRARQLLDRCAALTPDQLRRLHGAIRDFREVGRS